VARFFREVEGLICTEVARQCRVKFATVSACIFLNNFVDRERAQYAEILAVGQAEFLVYAMFCTFFCRFAYLYRTTSLMHRNVSWIANVLRISRVQRLTARFKIEQNVL